MLEAIGEPTAVAAILIAAMALVLNYFQFGRLEESLRAATYQELTHAAFELLKIVIDQPAIRYMDIDPHTENRQQVVFDRLLSNHLGNAWNQRTNGMIEDSEWKSYEGLMALLATHHPSSLESIPAAANHSPSFRRCVKSLLSRADRDARRSRSAPNRAEPGPDRTPPSGAG